MGNHFNPNEFLDSGGVSRGQYLFFIKSFF